MARAAASTHAPVAFPDNRDAFHAEQAVQSLRKFVDHMAMLPNPRPACAVMLNTITTLLPAIKAELEARR